MDNDAPINYQKMMDNLIMALLNSSARTDNITYLSKVADGRFGFWRAHGPHGLVRVRAIALSNNIDARVLVVRPWPFYEYQEAVPDIQNDHMGPLWVEEGFSHVLADYLWNIKRPWPEAVKDEPLVWRYVKEYYSGERRPLSIPEKRRAAGGD